ncbi:MAG: AMP-binding protein [Porticoccaceae bacterium]
MNISDVLERQAYLLKQIPCIHFPDGYWSFDYLNRCVWQVAHLLHCRGVAKGDVVAHTFHNKLLLLVTMIATARIGATVFSVPLKLPSVRRSKVLSQVNASYLATDLGGLQYGILESIQVGMEALDQPENNIEKSCKDDRPTAPWILVEGSGSTGNPKLMAVSHRQQLFRMEVGLEWLPYSSDDVLLSLIDLDYYGPKQRYLEAFTKGSSVAFVDHKQENIGKSVKDQNITVIYATVFHIERILHSLPVGDRGYLKSLNALMIGGSSVSSNLRNTISDRLCANLYVLYGANECHTTCCTQIPEVYEVQGSVGRPHKGFDLQIVDELDSPMPASRVGQIRVRSEAMIEGYFNDKPGTASAFRHGWFYPGDLGKLTPGGQLIHMGRSDDLMIMNGINIYPAEIEKTLYEYSDVIDVVAFPLRHPIHQDIPVCAASLKAGAQISERELMAFANQHLGAHAPKIILILDKIPRNKQGKPIRKELDTLITSRLETDSNSAFNKVPQKKTDSSRQTRNQLTRNITFTCVVPRQVNLEVLDNWFTELVLKDNADNEIEDFYPEYDNIPRVTGWWLWRCMQLFRFILQACRIPVFDTPEIIAYQQEGQNQKKINLTVAVTQLDNLPKGIYLTALEISFFLAEKSLTQEPNTENLQSFFKIIQNRILAPYSPLLPPGKSTLPILRVARQKGIPFRHMGNSVYQLGWGSKARFLDRSTTEVDSAMGSKLSQSKLVTAQLLRSAGLPASRHQAVTKQDDAQKVARQFGWPVVVKPTDRDGGVGITVNIDDPAKLKAAYALARKHSHSKQVIVEQQVLGVCHRLFIAHGKLLYVVKRLPMSVTGDNTLSVAELVKREVLIQRRKPPWARSRIIPLDSPALAAISAAGFSTSSVPGERVQVPLRNIESTEWGGIDEDVSNQIHPENLQMAISAAALFRLNVAGIDIISQDIATPWHENNAIINEVNFAPLLGGGEISRRHIPAFLDQYIRGNGRIPVEVFVGGKSAWQAASEKQQTLLTQGVNSHISNGIQTLDASGKTLRMLSTSLFESARALALLPNVEAIVLVVQTDEFINTGLPLEFVDTINHVDEHLMSFKSNNTVLPPKRTKRMIQLMTEWNAV